MMGMKNVEIATEAEFDISVDEDDFKLPDFPIRDEMGASIDKSGLEKMDHRAQKDAQQAQAQMAAMMGAMANAGVQKGQTPSASQMEAMQQGMLPMAKQQMLSEESNIRETRTCLEDADSLKEAQQCQKKFGDTEEDDPLADWSPQTKKQTLKEIDQYLDVTIPCVKKAQSMNALEQCMM
ncbi:MAG: hypothetical protein IE918_09750 [Campylobacterales bacterium]|nr:hypothetical protein [Campylobacterales bacterium]